MRTGRDESVADPSGCSPERVLAEGLSARFGRTVRIVAVESEELPQSSHAINRWRVSLDSGERLPVIFKRVRAGEKPRGNEREVLIYRRLLAGGRFGAPLLYASVYDEAAGRFWLFLEDVGSSTLKHGDTADWLAAFRWLGELHGSHLGREDELRALDCLSEPGWAFYQAVAEEGRQNLLRAGHLAAVRRFEALWPRLDAVAAHLNRQPRTLVHGDLFVQNLMLSKDSRIRAIDWEAAFIGSAEWDITGLLAGWPASQKREFVRAYLEASGRHTGVPVTEAAIAGMLERYRMVKDLWYLSWSVSLCRDEANVAVWLDGMEAVWSRI